MAKLRLQSDSRANGGPIVFYPYFPRYRLEILWQLSRLNSDARFLGGVEPRESLVAITEREFPPLVSLRNLQLGPFAWQFGAFSNCVSRSADVVITAPAIRSLSVWATVIVRRMLRRRTYLWGQCGKPKDRSVKRYLQEILNRLATGLLVYGYSERNAAAELGLDPRKITVVRNATSSLDRLSVLAAPYPTNAERAARVEREGLTIAYIGRLLDSKRIDILVAALSILSSTVGAVKLLVIGDGPARAGVLKVARELDVEVVFVGELHDFAAIREHLNASFALVAPAEIGLLAIDGLVHGIPVMAPINDRANGPEVEALTFGVNAGQFAHSDAKSLADAIAGWVEVAPSIDWQSYEGARTRALEEWTAENVARNLLNAVGFPVIAEN